ncbi:hypothetical protein RND81_02G207300 [Saponaria officinalis]|uniref:DUF6598 domain-containing protein n=1 Tax=Saponaria officinalis TaxID=3572 RepID=A0AAW1MX55_SAPOF
MTMGRRRRRRCWCRRKAGLYICFPTPLVSFFNFLSKTCRFRLFLGILDHATLLPSQPITSLVPSHVGQEVVDEEVEAYLIECRKFILPGEDLSLCQYYEDRLRINGVTVGDRHLLSSPLFELHSVEVFPETEKSCYIYGEISLTDGKGNSIILYKKNKDEAEWIEEDDNELSITDHITIVPLKYKKVSVRLMDRNLSSISVVNRSFNVESSTSDFWSLKHHTVYGNGGYVTVYYRSIFAAVVADFDLTLYKEVSNTDDNGAEIYGVVRARRDSPFAGDRVKFDLTLFDKEEDEAVRVEYGESVELSRNQLIVPTCSSLSLFLKLFDSNTDSTVAKIIVKLEAFKPYTPIHEVWSDDNMWSAVVHVSWSLLDDFLDRYDTPKIENLSIEKLSLTSHNESYSAENDGFSGTITVRDDDGVSYVFKEDDLVHDICLWWPSRCFKAPNFRMNLKLLYREGITACHGYLDLSYQPEHLNKKLCSVIRSNLSFVTIYYSVFRKCLQGNVFIKFISPGSAPMDVDGSIFAQTSNFEETSYDKYFYRNVLFKVPDHITYYCESESYLPLQKSVIVGPIDGSVIITTDVVVYKAFARYNDAVLRGDMKFKVGHDETKIIMSQGYEIIVTLQWVYV